MNSAPKDIPDWSAAEDNNKRVCARPLGSAPIPPVCNDCRCLLAAKVSHLAALPIGSHALHLTRGPLELALCSSMLCPFGELQTAMEGIRPVAFVLVLVYSVQTARAGPQHPKRRRPNCSHFAPAL